jgi:hypothetical protein
VFWLPGSAKRPSLSMIFRGRTPREPGGPAVLFITLRPARVGAPRDVTTIQAHEPGDAARSLLQPGLDALLADPRFAVLQGELGRR